jgi:hypothetical protein
MVQFHGDDRAGPLLRKFGVRYSELHPCHDEVKRAFLAVATGDDWRELLDRWYAEADRYPSVQRRARPEALIAAGASWDCASSDS